ncbi:MAG TPA: hypothetical protein VGM19_14365 [Armatimonadota bacterium]
MALPYLATLAVQGWPMAFERLRLIGTPAALKLLRDLAASREPRTGYLATRRLQLLETPTAEAPPSAGLVQKLAGEGGSTVICAGAPADLAQLVSSGAPNAAERLAQAGYETQAAGDGKLVVLRKHSATEDARPAESVLVALSRLVAALSPDDLKLLDKWDSIRCADLSVATRPALAEVLALLADSYAFRGTQVTATEVPPDLYLRLTPTYHVAERGTRPDGTVFLSLDDSYSRLYSGPPLGLPAEVKPLAGSPLWWLWPYGGSAGAERPLALPAGVPTVGGVLEAIRRDLGVSVHVDPQSQDALRTPLCVAGPPAPLGHVLWALQVLTGQVFHVVAADPWVVSVLPPFAISPPGGARRPNSPVSELLEAYAPGYLSPLHTAAGRLLIEGSFVGDMGMPLNVVWRTADLPNVYSLAFKPRTPDPGAAEPRERTLMWLGGLAVSLEKKQGHQGTGLGTVFLPLF